MLMMLKVIAESIRQAFSQLTASKLRSFLSLLGITIGIWCVITVLSAVDSLEHSIVTSFEELGNDVVYVSKEPWMEDRRANRWKYKRRPNTGYSDYKALAKKVKSGSQISYGAFVGLRSLEYQSFNVSNSVVLGTTYDYVKMFNLVLDQGRYFSPVEFQNGSNQIVIGFKIAEALFPSGIDPIGKKVKLLGRKMQVIGVLEKEGTDLLNPLNFDEVVIMPYTTASNFINTKRSRGGLLNVKAKDGVSLEELKGEITNVMRAHRRLAPKEKDNFALNTISVFTNMLKTLFSSISWMGIIIAGFSILVGGFGVANIMFVSVKERTNIIGVKKALGAKSSVILTEFLIESVILCLLGGAIGLGLVYLLAQVATNVFEIEFFVSLKNVIIGLGTSVIIGVIAGFLPAVQASNMDPVEAIRA